MNAGVGSSHPDSISFLVTAQPGAGEAAITSAAAKMDASGRSDIGRSLAGGMGSVKNRAVVS
jgi:hypothetical protein